jgi:hypothetical protein
LIVSIPVLGAGSEPGRTCFDKTISFSKEKLTSTSLIFDPQGSVKTLDTTGRTGSPVFDKKDDDFTRLRLTYSSASLTAGSEIKIDSWKLFAEYIVAYAAVIEMQVTNKNVITNEILFIFFSWN